MNIILVSSRFAKVRSITLNGTHLLLAALLAMGLLLAAVFALQYTLIRFHPDAMSTEMRAWLASVQAEGQQKQQSYLREGLDTMAARMGQMQAQLLRLDALGARLAKLSGIKPQEFNFDQPPAQGGPYIPAMQQDVSLSGMNQQLANLSALLNDRNDKLMALETLLMQSSLEKKQFPSVPPTMEGWHSSNFGWRLDPFTGKNAMHEGVDFMVPEGSPILASAGGVVVYSDYHPQYGNMVELDHGNDIITRYAHASRLLVKVGQIVRRGQEIAKVGNTGRSTGNHLHFEVRYKGHAQNPTRFLQSAAS
ncbi:MAG: M23 family metallopeptidase [Betaproteobacteria bacterium]|nr:M23 family metallopeptidase [Betaproteobacteria bacterium]MDE2309572.1 M23 family metallopeptidase [Betaproteobacteria bacterium]